MKFLVNQVEVEWTHQPSATTAFTSIADQLFVHTPEGTFSALVIKNRDKTLISFRGRVYEIERKTRHQASSKTHEGEFFAPMPGQVVDVFAELHDVVEQGQKLVVLEAMKTQHIIAAPYQATVVQLPIRTGEQVNEGALLIKLEPVSQVS